MNKKLNLLKNILIVEIILMLVAGVYSIWTIINNVQFFYEGDQVVWASAMQIKFIIAIVLISTTIIWSLRLMIKLLCNIEKTKIFHKDNIRIMERIAIYLGIYGLFTLIGATANISIFLGVANTTIVETDLRTLNISKFGINFSIEVLAVISVVSIIIAMIEVIKSSIKIQEENELPV